MSNLLQSTEEREVHGDFQVSGLGHCWDEASAFYEMGNTEGGSQGCLCPPSRDGQCAVGVEGEGVTWLRSRKETYSFESQ